MSLETSREISYSTVDKSEWGDGPWQEEPDKLQFNDPETLLPCLIVRGPSGALCGYVAVEEGHPFFGVDYDSDASVPINHTCGEPWCSPCPGHVLRVHGGITYSDFCQEGDEEKTVCHVPAPGQSDRVWWLGFDCAHHLDLTPAYVHLTSPVPEFYRNDIYRDLAYVKAECVELAKQLIEVAA